jgi:hypothetical protein
MAGSLVNLSLLLDDEVGLSNALQGVIANGLTLTSYTDGTGVPTLSNGRTGELAGALYRVEGGDMAVDVTAVSGDGTYYIYINPSLLTAYASATVPTWRGDLGGFYLASDSNVKAFFRFVKSSTSYNNRTTLIQTVGYVPAEITANVTGTLSPVSEYFNSNGALITKDDIYQAISPYIISVNNSIFVRGAIRVSSSTFIIFKGKRTDTEEITLSGHAPAGGQYSITVTNGDTASAGIVSINIIL